MHAAFRPQPHLERHAGQRRVRVVPGEQRRERRIGVDHGVAEPLRHGQSRAVTAGCRHRQSTGRENHAIARQIAARGRDRECGSGARQVADRGLEADLDALGSRVRDQAVANVPRAIGSRKQLAGLLLERQWNVEIALEELALLVQRPRAQHAAQQVGRRIGDEALGCQHRRQHVAAAAAADQDLAAAILGAFEQRDGCARRGGKGRGDQTSRAGANDDHGRHRSIHLG